MKFLFFFFLVFPPPRNRILEDCHCFVLPEPLTKPFTTFCFASKNIIVRNRPLLPSFLLLSAFGSVLSGLNLNVNNLNVRQIIIAWRIEFNRTWSAHVHQPTQSSSVQQWNGRISRFYYRNQELWPFFFASLLFSMSTAKRMPIRTDFWRDSDKMRQINKERFSEGASCLSLYDSEVITPSSVNLSSCRKCLSLID